MTNREEIAYKIFTVSDDVLFPSCDQIADWHISEIENAKQEVLDYIALGEGWEETRDFYAEKLGLTVKYKK